MQMYDEAENGTDRESFRTRLNSYLTVDAHQLLISNRRNLDSLHSLQVEIRVLMWLLCSF
jgi:hypothetical protein